MEPIVKEIYTNVMEGQDKAVKENVQSAIDAGIPVSVILNEGMIAAMAEVGHLFEEGECFVPEMLVAARAMQAGLSLLKPHLKNGEVVSAGKVAIGTVKGDLHDIGKNLVAMMVEGGGWEVIDLGVDAGSEKFIKVVEEKPEAVIGLSALLTTTMENMNKIVTEIKNKYSGTKILIGGAPVTIEFCRKIGADFYAPDPQGAVNYLNKFAS